MLARYGNKMIDEDINRERYNNEDFRQPANFDHNVNPVYGEDIDPNRSSRIIRAQHFKRQHVVNTITPNSVKPGATLIVEMPKLGKNDMIVPGSVFLSFNMDISGTKDVKRSVVPNLGRKIVKKVGIKFESKPEREIDEYDEIMTYMDLWLSKKEKTRRVFQGIQTEEGLKHRVKSNGASGDAGEQAIGKTLGKRFRIPFDFFELLNDVIPFSQYHLREKLQFEFTFNDAKSVIVGSTDVLASSNERDYGYAANDIKLEYDIITDGFLSQSVMAKYNRMIVPVRHIMRYTTKTINKTDTIVNLPINVDVDRLSHVLILAIDPDDRKEFRRNDTFKNLDVTKVKVQYSGHPNQLYSGDLLTENSYDQVLKLFDSNGVTMGEFLTTKYVLCLDFRPSTDFKLHGNGLKLNDELKIEINRAGSGSGNLNLHVFLLKDGHLNIHENGFRNILV